MKTIKIFLASSAELKSDREQFELFINRKNKQWMNQGMFLELIIWEDFLNALSQTRLQDEYNKAIRECDLFVMLLFTKVGKYTEEEFEAAFRQFKQTNKPIIFTYFKIAELTTGAINKNDQRSLLNFQKKLSRFGHFYTRYKNTEDLLLQFGNQLDKLAEKNFIEMNKPDIRNSRGKSGPKMISAKNKPPHLKSIEFLKILEKQRLSKEAREKVRDAIDILKLAGISMMVLGQQETSALKIKLLSPVNTAVRWPFAFRWRIETKDDELYDKSKPKLLLKIFENSQQTVFAQEVTGKDSLEIPVALQEKVAKGQWYKWRVEAFNKKGELVGTSAIKDNSIEIDSEFQILAQEDILKSLVDKYNAFASEQEKAGFNPHVILGAIYQSLLLRDEAVNEFKKAIEKKPTEKYLYERAIAVLQQQGLSEEIVQLKQALKDAIKH